MTADSSSRANRSHGTIVLENTTTDTLVVRLEPWADEHAVPRGERIEVDFAGPSGGCLEIVVGTKEVVLYAWEDTVLCPASERPDTRPPDALPRVGWRWTRR